MKLAVAGMIAIGVILMLMLIGFFAGKSGSGE